jgi:hypothetical protein
MDSNLAQLRKELEGAIAGMSETSMAQAPEGKWSAAQILEHLFLTYRNTNRGLAKCAEKDSPLATSAALKHRLGKLLVVNLGYMPGGRKAPERAMPRGTTPAAELRETIFAEIEQMDSGLKDCERRFGAGTEIMDHPFIGPLTSNQWRKFHLVHGRHHAGRSASVENREISALMERRRLAGYCLLTFCPCRCRFPFLSPQPCAPVPEGR